LDEQLDLAVEGFVGTPEHFTLDREDPAILHLNKVMDWYQDDFGGPTGLKEFFGPYLDAESEQILRSDATQLGFFEYDWTLNDTPR
jgi:hypothetical protein